jgi:hypothetical protein
VKFSRPGQCRVSPVSDVDVGIYQLQCSENLLGERIKVLGLEADKYGTYTLSIQKQIQIQRQIIQTYKYNAHYTYKYTFYIQIHFIHINIHYTYKHTLYLQIHNKHTTCFIYTLYILLHTIRTCGPMGLSVSFFF